MPTRIRRKETASQGPAPAAQGEAAIQEPAKPGPNAPVQVDETFLLMLIGELYVEAQALRRQKR